MKKGPESYCQDSDPFRLILHCLFLCGLFQGFFLLPDPLVQIRHTLLNLLLNTADHLFLLSREFEEISVYRVRTAAINLGHLLYSAIEIRQHLVAVLQTVGFQKGRWLNASARKGKTPGSNQGRRSETAICIYGLKEKIRA